MVTPEFLAMPDRGHRTSHNVSAISLCPVIEAGLGDGLAKSGGGVQCEQLKMGFGPTEAVMLYG
jgi:hypothetical protein